MTGDLPAYAYIPGQTPRHAEGSFDPLRVTARAGMGAEQLSRCAAWRTGLTYLEAGFNWEAHELMEPVWMALPEGSNERRLVQMMIQLANASLKARMERPRAVLRLCVSVSSVAAGLPDDVFQRFGVSRSEVVSRVERLVEWANRDVDYAK